jgi:hypothetical protein
MEESDSKSYTGIPCLLSKEAKLKIRRYIFHGTESFANRATDHKWLRSVFGPSFDDVEIAISADGFTCERAPMIRPDEYATFVRITEKWSKDAAFVIENTSPRSLTIGLVLSLTGNSSRPAVFRMWDECPIKWVGGSGDKPLAALNDPSELDKIIHELKSGFSLACSKPLEQLQRESNLATTASNDPSSPFDPSVQYAMGNANATSGAGSNAAAAGAGSARLALTSVSEMPEVE